jgi:hypothetical protein
LDPYTDFALSVPSQFFQSYYAIDGMYDRRTHRYLPLYLKADRLTLIVSSQIGLLHAKAVEGSLAPGTAGQPARTATGTPAQQFRAAQQEKAMKVARMAQAPPFTNAGWDAGFSKSDPRLPPPKDLIAYEWLVFHTGTPWRKHLIIQNPAREDTIVGFAIDGAGSYSVTVRVYWKGNRYAERTVTFTVVEKFIVGMGDSYASGEGNPDRDGKLSKRGQVMCSEYLTTLRQAAEWSADMEEEPEWLDQEFHRSLQGFQPTAAAALQTNYGETWSPDGGQRATNFNFVKVTWASFARSGAEIVDGLLKPQQGVGDDVGIGQIQECKTTVTDRRPIDALLISIGGNDAGFVGVLSDLTQKWSFWTIFSLEAPRLPKDVKAARLKALEQALGIGLPVGQEGSIAQDLNLLNLALLDLSQTIPIKHVFLTGYPTDLFYGTNRNGQREYKTCGIFATKAGLFTITEDDAKIIHDAGVALNALLKSKCQQFGWHFVDTAPVFAQRGYCDNDLWIDADESCEKQGNQRGTMHPSWEGHYLAAQVLTAELQRYNV